MSGDSKDPHKNDSNRIPSDKSPPELCKQKHRHSDNLFKNLLRPIELLSKKNSCEQPLQYDLLQELDSYLDYIRTNSDDHCFNVMFTEAAIMFQNVTLLYQKRVDQACYDMMNLIKKFQAYRLCQKQNNDDENNDKVVNKNKKKDKEVKGFYFEPINQNVMSSLKQFDCKLVDLRKIPLLPKMILNTNIKVNNKYCQILPYISIQTGDNLGKKYDFLVNSLLNCDLAVDEEFDCAINANTKLTPLILNPMGIDVVDFNNVNPNDPHPDNPILFNETFDDEIRVCNEILLQADLGNVINVSEIHLMLDDDDANPWPQVTKPEYDIYSDVTIVQKKVHKHKDNEGQLSSFRIDNYCNGYCAKLRNDMFPGIDPIFSKIIYEVQKAQRLEIKKHVYGYEKEVEEHLNNGDYEKEVEEQLNNEAFHCNDDDFLEVEEQPLEDNEHNYEIYVDDMRKHQEQQLKSMNEQLEMRNRVEDWHNKLRPILADEERRTVFDVHEYGTRVLNCFQFIGEQKSFKDLVGGLGQEEVSRYYLSILMMVNTNNLSMKNDLNDEIIIELLKKERHHEELQVNIGNQVNQNLN